MPAAIAVNAARQHKAPPAETSGSGNAELRRGTEGVPLDKQVVAGDPRAAIPDSAARTAERGDGGRRGWSRRGIYGSEG